MMPWKVNCGDQNGCWWRGGKGEKCVVFSPSLRAAAEAFWFKRINGSVQGYFSLTGAVQNNTPGPYFLEGALCLAPIVFTPSLFFDHWRGNQAWVPWITARVDEQLQCSNDLLSLITGPPKKKGKRRENGGGWEETAGRKGKKKEVSSEIFRDIQFTDRDVLLSASSYPEQMLNGLIDRKS